MNAHQKALILFAVALGVVVAIASATTLERIHTYKVSKQAIPSTIGLAKPRIQLDRAPGKQN